MNKNKLIQVTPTLILAGVLTYTWYIITTTDYVATIKHQIGLVALSAIIVFYFFKFKYGILSTGVYLVLATFNVIAIFPITVSSSYFIKIGGTKISTPPIQWKAVLLLIIFLICVERYLKNLYIEYRNKRTGKNN